MLKINYFSFIVIKPMKDKTVSIIIGKNIDKTIGIVPLFPKDVKIKVI